MYPKIIIHLYKQLLYIQVSIEKDIKSTVNLQENEKTVINVMYTFNWMKEHSIAMYKDYDLSSEQYNVLRILRGQKGNPANLITIQERMLNKMSNTTRLVDKLIIKGLVTRITCKSNRRKIEICITKKGLQLLSKLDPIVNANNSLLTQNLELKELEALNSLLDKLRT